MTNIENKDISNIKKHIAKQKKMLQKQENILKQGSKIFYQRAKMQFDNVFKGNTDSIPQAHKRLKELFLIVSPKEKLKTITNIFADFKQKKYTNFNSPEIWTGFLYLIKNQKDIKNDAVIDLPIADGGTRHLKCTVGEIKNFLDAFEYPNQTNCKYRNITDFLSSLSVNKPYLKIIDSNNHFTGLVIEKTSERKYKISHLNSITPKFKTIECDDNTIHTELLRINMLSASRENLFNDTILFKSHEEPTDNQYHHNFDFIPFSQYTNCCHQISVMNLLKYYVENYSDDNQYQNHGLTEQPKFSFDLSLLQKHNQDKNDGIRILDTFSLNRDYEIATLDTISVNRDDFTVETCFDAKNNTKKSNRVDNKFDAQSIFKLNKFLLQYYFDLPKADKNQN